MSARNHIESAMRSHFLVYAIVLCLVGYGIYALTQMKKDEFPEVTIRLGVVAGVYPGATAQEVEEQVAKPIEQYLFTFKEIDKRKTYSISQDGIVYVFAALSSDVMNSDEAWAKIRGGISLLKQGSCNLEVFWANPQVRSHGMICGRMLTLKNTVYESISRHECHPGVLP